MSRIPKSNLSFSTLVRVTRGYANKDIIACPECGSLDLKDKQYIITPGTMLYEVIATCRACKEQHYIKVKLKDSQPQKKNPTVKKGK